MVSLCRNLTAVTLCPSDFELAGARAWARGAPLQPWAFCLAQAPRSAHACYMGACSHRRAFNLSMGPTEGGKSTKDLNQAHGSSLNGMCWYEGQRFSVAAAMSQVQCTP